VEEQYNPIEKVEGVRTELGEGVGLARPRRRRRRRRRRWWWWGGSLREGRA